MSQAVHVGTNHGHLMEWFECPECGVRQPVTAQVWQTVEVLGRKPTLDCCHHPHIPPSPAALREHADAHALAELLAKLPEVR